MAQPVTRPKFKVGDRVRYVKTLIVKWGDVQIGDTGTVIVVEPNSNIGVEFDRYVGGHTLNGACNDGFGFWMLPGEFELIASEPNEALQLPNLEQIF